MYGCVIQIKTAYVAIGFVVFWVTALNNVPNPKRNYLLMARSHCPGPGQGQGPGPGTGPGGTVHTAPGPGPGPGPGNIMRALLTCPKNCSISPCAFVFAFLKQRNVVNS